MCPCFFFYYTHVRTVGVTDMMVVAIHRKKYILNCQKKPFLEYTYYLILRQTMNVILWHIDTVQWLVPNVTVILTAKIL